MTKTALATILLLAAAAAQAAVTAGLGQGSKLWIEGGSTLHPWESAATSMAMAVSIESQAMAAGMAAHAPAKVTLTVPVTAMKSEHSGLDKNMRKALKADKNPDIVFSMTGYKMDQKAGTVAAEGALSIAGVTKPETIIAKFAEKDGRLVLDGEQPILMTDFGVKPPTMMMGTVKVDDRVLVKFHIELQ